MDEKKVKLYKQLVQTYQNLAMQRQAIMVELAEMEKALKELESHDGRVFKSLGTVLIETTKEKAVSELSEKKEEYELKLKSLDKQVETVEQRIEKLRKELE